MKKLFIITLLLIPTTSQALSTYNNKYLSRQEKQFEYQCIDEKRDDTTEHLNSCIKEKKGSSVITLNKFWEQDPAKRNAPLQ